MKDLILGITNTRTVIKRISRSFRLSRDTVRNLEKLAVINNTTKTNVIEFLINEKFKK